MQDLEDAIIEQDLSAVQSLLAEGADLNARYSSGRTALHIAAALGDIAICTALIHAHAALDAQDASGDTPLMLAAFAGCEDVVRLLVDSGCDLNLRNSSGMSASSWAEAGDFPEISQYLVSSGAEDPYQRTKLHYLANRWADGEAVNADEASEIRALVAEGVDIKAQDQFGITALMMAAGNGDRELTKLLLELGADVLLADQEQVGAITWAEESGDEETVNLLKTAIDAHQQDAEE